MMTDKAQRTLNLFRERNLLRELESTLTQEIEAQRQGPQTWRNAWLKALDRVYKPFEG